MTVAGSRTLADNSAGTARLPLKSLLLQPAGARPRPCDARWSHRVARSVDAGEESGAEKGEETGGKSRPWTS